MIRCICICFLCLLFQQTYCQPLPAEGRKLHYRRIAFVAPEQKTATAYKLEIAAGTVFSEDSFSSRRVLSVRTKLARALQNVPWFGKDYTWRMDAYLKNGKVVKGAFHHFSTLWIPEVDSCEYRLRVMKPAAKYKDANVFIDGHRVLYDLSGNPIWFLPLQETSALARYEIRDLKASDAGTITYMQHDKAFEVSYDCDTLWQAPGNRSRGTDSPEHYHHEFTRLPNGHYMVLGTELVFWKYRFGALTDSAAEEEPAAPGAKGSSNLKIEFGTVLEYDSAGNKVWEWKSSQYFMQSDLVNYRSEHRSKVIDVHENAFYFDEPNKVLYVSFKNISRILKVRYPDGALLNTYGEIYQPGKLPEGNGLFCDQHACKKSKSGLLYMYNNNACNDSAELPTVLAVKEAASGADSLYKVWEYHCSIDGVNFNPSIKDLKARQKYLEQHNLKPRLGRGTLLRATSGGNVAELPDHSLFVCMNTQYCKVFMVSHEKKLLWSAVPERYNSTQDAWYITPQQYRSAIVTGAELDRLIWKSAGK